MASDVGIANLALLKLGKARITSFNDNNAVAAAINENYPLLRDTLQRMGWNFCRRYAALAAAVGTPAFGYAYAYPLPSDYLRVEFVTQAQATPQVPPGQISSGPLIVDVGLPGADLTDYNNDWSQEYRIVGQQIYTNYFPPVSISYYARISDPNQFDAYFIEAFACYLAAQLCERVTGSTAKQQRLDGLYREAMAQAKKYGAIENPPVRIPDDTHMLARLRS